MACFRANSYGEQPFLSTLLYVQCLISSWCLSSAVGFKRPLCQKSSVVRGTQSHIVQICSWRKREAPFERAWNAVSSTALRHSKIVKSTEGRKLFATNIHTRFDATVDTCLVRFSVIKTIPTGCADVFMVLDGGGNEVLGRNCVANARRPLPGISINALPFDILRRGR